MTDSIDALLAAERAAPLPGAEAAKNEVLRNVLAQASVTAVAVGWSTQALVLAALLSGVAGAVMGGAVVHTLSDAEHDRTIAPTVQPPAEIEAPAIEPPAIEPAAIEPPAMEPPAIEPSAIEPPAIEPRATEAPLVATPFDHPEPAAEALATPALPQAPPTRRPVLEPTAEPAQPEASSLREERALIDQAASALRAGRPRDALVALMTHERRFSAGTLAEERDQLSVEALVRLGRAEQARRRAALFEQRYPRSLSADRVRALVQDLGE